MPIALASDHAGYRYKRMLHQWLATEGHVIVDFGTDSERPVDYPDFVHPAAGAVARGECERGIVVGGSGNGEAMAANRHRGIRCAICWNDEIARLSRSRTDANMLALGQRLLDEETVRRIVSAWLVTSFEGGRHDRRLARVDQ
jgi:ribose 5-phosphate isomerase B